MRLLHLLSGRSSIALEPTHELWLQAEHPLQPLSTNEIELQVELTRNSNIFWDKLVLTCAHSVRQFALTRTTISRAEDTKLRVVKLASRLPPLGVGAWRYFELFQMIVVCGSRVLANLLTEKLFPRTKEHFTLKKWFADAPSVDFNERLYSFGRQLNLLCFL